MSKYSSSKSGLLKDNSWIKRQDDEDEFVDQDPNFGRSVLGRTRADETSVSSSEVDPVNSGTTPTKSSSVLSLSKRFGGQDDTKPSSVPQTKPTTTYQKRYSAVTIDTPSSVTTTVKEEPKTSTTTTTVTKNGVTTETTTTSSSQIIKSPEIKTSTAFTDRVKTSSKDAQYSTYTPTRTTKVTEKTVTSTKDADDKFFDTLLTSSEKDDFSSANSKTTVTMETVKVKSSADVDTEDKLYDSLIPRSIKNNASDGKSALTSYETVTIKSSVIDDADDDFIPGSFKDSSSSIKTSMTSTETWTVKSSSNIDTKTTKTSYLTEDHRYDSLLPKAITTSPIRSESPTLSPTPTSLRTSSYSSYTEDSPSSRTNSYSNTYSKTYSYSRPDTSYEYTSATSPSVYASQSYKGSSWSDDAPTSLSYSKSSSSKSLYQTPERPVLEKDLCTVCRKPFTGDAKMILDDMNINCHATCFKCHVCNSSMSNMKAGDSMWIYKRMVHCENCFEDTRDKWRR